MSRILFVDDCPARQKWASEHLDEGDNYLAVASNVESAIAWIEWGQPDEFWIGPFWDEVYLDHDLGEEVYVDSSRKDCGMEVVRWIVENRPKIGKVIVHTMNAPAGHEMVSHLRLAGYDAEYRSFYRMVSEQDQKSA